MVSIPSLLQSPSPLLARQWKILFDNGIVVVVPACVASSAAFAYLAYDASRGLLGWSSPASKLLGGASLAAIMAMPYTAALMPGVNDRLTTLAKKFATEETESKEVQPDVAGTTEVHGLVRQWGKLNLARAFFPLVAAVLGAWEMSASR